MKPSVKAALISGLVFPGLGHLALRRPLRGCLFLLPTALALFYLARRVTEMVDVLQAELNSGALPFDPVAILERVHSFGVNDGAANLASLVCIACWIGSVADVLWLGRQTSSSNDRKDLP